MVAKPCMDPPKGLVIPDWPQPNPDGSFTLSPKQAAEVSYFLGQLHDYIGTQLAKCGVK